VSVIGPSGREYYVPVTPGIENGQHGCALTELAEERRAQRHHEVLCLVIEQLVPQVSSQGRHVAESNPHASWPEIVVAARTVADLAYPPPEKT